MANNLSFFLFHFRMDFFIKAVNVGELLNESTATVKKSHNNWRSFMNDIFEPS